jgi:4-hydroxybenzoate polyprenyltransferase
MKPLLKMIRWPNLLMLVLGMVLLQYVLIRPGLALPEQAGLSPLGFWLLTASVLFIAMGGYVINDLKDLPADIINKPGGNVFEKTFSEKQGRGFYWIFTLAGIISGTLVSLLYGHVSFSLIFILTAGLLWFYAARYQCQVLIGNIVVAFLSTLALGLVWLYEVMALQMQHLSVDPVRLYLVNKLVLIYMGFAFLVSLLREVVKDVGDEKGDRKTGCLTLPVAYGTHKARNTALVLSLFGLIGSFVIQWFFYQWHFVYLFFWFFLVDGWFAFVSLKLMKAADKKEWHQISLWIKILMVTGILSMALFYFE